MTGLSPNDEKFLRHAIKLANLAVDRGKRPFAALIVDRRGEIVAEGYPTLQEDRDWTAHSEMNVIRAAGKKCSWDELAGCTLYASGDPCPMCAGAVYWSNIRRVVFGVDEEAMRPYRQSNPKGAGILMSCREVLSKAPHFIEVIGPALIDEAIQPHERFWRPSMKIEGWV